MNQQHDPQPANENGKDPQPYKENLQLRLLGFYDMQQLLKLPVVPFITGAAAECLAILK